MLCTFCEGVCGNLFVNSNVRKCGSVDKINRGRRLYTGQSCGISETGIDYRGGGGGGGGGGGSGKKKIT